MSLRDTIKQLSDLHCTATLTAWDQNGGSDKLLEGLTKANQEYYAAVQKALAGENPEPEPEPEPEPVPVIGFPDATNTGTRRALVHTHVGAFHTSSDGQVIQDFEILGEIRIHHNNVKVRNTRVVSTGGHAVYINGNTGLVIEDCEFWGQNHNAEPVIAEHNYTMRRCNIRGYGEGPRINGNVTIEDCYMHDFPNFVPMGAHQDGIQATSGSNIIIRHNTILITPDGANGAIFFSDHGGHNILIEKNLVGGGNWAINLDHRVYHDVKILSNAFTTKIEHHEQGGHFAPIAPGRGSNWEVKGNYWYDGLRAGQLI